MKKLLEENQSFTQIVYEAGHTPNRPPTHSDRFTYL